MTKLGLNLPTNVGAKLDFKHQPVDYNRERKKSNREERDYFTV
jgi:hypothetical protein